MSRPSRRGEEALRESEQKVRSVVENMSEGLMLFDANGDTIYQNAAALRIHGVDAAGGRFKHDDLPVTWKAWDEQGRPLSFEEWPISRVLRNEQFQDQVLHAERVETGHSFDASHNGCPIRDAEGKLVYGFITIREITEQVRARASSWRQLPADTPQAARARQVIRRQTEHLARLVDDLLDVTRISRGKIHLHREVVDLRNLVRRTCEDHRALFEEADIEMNLDFPIAPVWADVDATRIAQVIGNLLNNANKFTPPHGTVTVRLRGRDGHAEIQVRDTGGGMDPEQVTRMFEPFAQEDRSLARTRGGLGLGLALSKGLVDLHGGTIGASSQGPGTGSEFTITLPLTATTFQPAEASARTLSSASRRRVLIIEDNPDAARTLADVLEALGHDVAVARDGATGIALARALKPEVVICDLGLPDLDGYAVARALRQDEALRSTRLIALSGYAQPEDKERASKAGFEAHLPKPAPLEDLAELLA